MFGSEAFFKDEQMQLLCSDDTCAVYQMRGADGEGTTAYYPVFPGISVLFNDFHMASCPPRRFSGARFINIHHCREGRVESQVDAGSCVYLEPGDTMIENFAMAHRYCAFPLSHFHGIVVTIDVAQASDGLAALLSLFAVDLPALEARFAARTRPLILHGSQALDHLFAELYHLPETVRQGMLRLKVLELLLTLQGLDFEAAETERPYFYRSQIEKIKAIHALMTTHPDEHFTIEALAEQFALSSSALKLCFKGVYGTAIYTYMRNYRMNLAATLLTETDASVAEIAGRVGYSNSSKFARAFKEVKGVTPLAYRKIKI